jgi:glutathione S-transferase
MDMVACVGSSTDPVGSAAMTRTLYATLRSPFARKVRIALLEKQLPFELIEVDLSNRSPDFVAASPLGKVPVLVDEDGTRVFDSTVICEYLEDRYPQPSLLGNEYVTRLKHRALDELADTVGEQAVKLFYSERESAAALTRAKRALEHALDELEQQVSSGAVPAEFGLGHAAVLSALGYLAYRLGTTEIDERPALAAWATSFASRPSVQATPLPST